MCLTRTPVAGQTRSMARQRRDLPGCARYLPALQLVRTLVGDHSRKRHFGVLVPTKSQARHKPVWEPMCTSGLQAGLACYSPQHRRDQHSSGRSTPVRTLLAVDPPVLDCSSGAARAVADQRARLCTATVSARFITVELCKSAVTVRASERCTAA